MSENYVLQALVRQFGVKSRYWSMDNPRYEVGFLIQRENDIIPVEVKSDANVISTRLKKYNEKFSGETKLRVRLFLGNLRLDGDLLNILLFMADYTDKLIGMAWHSRQDSLWLVTKILRRFPAIHGQALDHTENGDVE